MINSYSTKEQPISLMTNKRKQGIYLVDENGKENFYSLKDFLSKPEVFTQAVRDQLIFEVGDNVKIIDVGQTYTTYYLWFRENNINIDIAARYAFGQNIVPTTEEYEIVAVGKHECGHVMYAISPIASLFQIGQTPIFLINEEGVAKV